MRLFIMQKESEVMKWQKALTYRPQAKDKSRIQCEVICYTVRDEPTKYITEYKNGNKLEHGLQPQSES